MRRLVMLSAVTALSACANQGDEGFIVLNNTAVTTTCALSGDPAAPFIAHGEIYSGSPQGYFMTPLIQSRVSSSGAGSGAGVDPTTRTIYLKGANVTLDVKAVSIEHGDGSFANTTITLPTDLAKFSALFSAALPPAGSVNVGFELIPVQTLRAIESAANLADTDRFRAEVLATVSVFGELNGDEQVAQPFTFPVTVCNDCVINDLGPCPVMATPRSGNACNPYQDGVFDCCEIAPNQLVCPARMGTAVN
jgi:hypothetical protein